MPEPDMYPLVDSPKYNDHFEDFDELRDTAENLFLPGNSLNYPFNWFFYDEQSEYWEPDEDKEPEFAFCIAMPGKTAFTVWRTNTFERAVVEEWLNSFVKGVVMRWYGWQS